MEKLTIRDGKFYRGNKQVRPEIGDREQTKLLEKKFGRPQGMHPAAPPARFERFLIADTTPDLPGLSTGE